MHGWFDTLCAQKGCCQCQRVGFFHWWCTLGVDVFSRLLVFIGGREMSSSWIRRRYVPASQPTQDTTPPNLRKCQQQKVSMLIWHTAQPRFESGLGWGAGMWFSCRVLCLARCWCRLNFPEWQGIFLAQGSTFSADSLIVFEQPPCAITKHCSIVSVWTVVRETW